MKKIAARGIIVTAPGNEVDFVSRFFAPQTGILEDPVTGSAHTKLNPILVEAIKQNAAIGQTIIRTGRSFKMYKFERPGGNQRAMCLVPVRRNFYSCLVGKKYKATVDSGEMKGNSID